MYTVYAAAIIGENIQPNWDVQEYHKKVYCIV